MTVLTLRRRVSPVAMRRIGKRRLGQSRKEEGGRRRPDVEWREIERKIVTNIMMMLIYDLPLAACHDQF